MLMTLKGNSKIELIRSYLIGEWKLILKDCSVLSSFYHLYTSLKKRTMSKPSVNLIKGDGYDKGCLLQIGHRGQKFI